MFVVVQFPIVDGRAFASESGRVDRPDWMAPTIPKLLVHRDFVRGFGRLANRREETTAAWIDEVVFAYAKQAVKFPGLRQDRVDGNRRRWSVNCRFRRLLCDGEAVARLEIGFYVRAVGLSGPEHAKPLISQLLELPTVVPGDASNPTAAKDLVMIGPSVARRYARATTRHLCDPAVTLVAAGEPITVVMTQYWEPSPPWSELILAAGTGTARYDPLCLTSTPTRHGDIETWYLIGPHGQQGRAVRLALLRQHAQEEALDRILRWTTTGALSYVPQSPEGDRLEKYINDATNVVNRNSYHGVLHAPLREALDKATATERASIQARRRQRLDGMRRQVREKAERFLAEREARKPTMNIYGGVVMGDQKNEFSGVFHGPVAGTVNAKVMQDSFNAFSAQQPNDDLKSAVAELYSQVGQLVGRLQEESPDEAADVTATLKDLTAKTVEDKPNLVTLRRLGGNIIEVAKKVAEFTTPVANAVLAVLKIFGIAAL
ncbi:hypothetical protein [Mycobacterium sp. NPDC004974]